MRCVLEAMEATSTDLGASAHMAMIDVPASGNNEIIVGDELRVDVLATSKLKFRRMKIHRVMSANVRRSIQIELFNGVVREHRASKAKTEHQVYGS